MIDLLLILNIYPMHQTGLKEMTLQAQFILLERKQFQSEISVGQLVNHNNVRRMISDDQILSKFKNIRGTPQYFHNMLLDVLSKIRWFGGYTFFLSGSAAELHWAEIIQVVSHQYGEILTDEQVNTMDQSTKVNY